MVLRSDEEANLAEVERDKKFRGNVGKGITAAASLATAATGTGIASRLMPFFSEYVPVDLAIKGISKISPKIGDLLKKGQSMGLDIKEGLDFVKNKLNPHPQQEPPKENRNIIEQYSPELDRFIKDHIQQGRSAIEAGALAQAPGKQSYRSVIDKIIKDHKAPWSSILESVYGQQGAQTAQRPQQAFAQQQTNQVGPGQQALMEILQKLQAARRV